MHIERGGRLLIRPYVCTNEAGLELDTTEPAVLVRSRQVSPVEVVQAHLDRIEEVNPRLNAI
jgi:Asp-tRNA(Asn)/Glu-tRNA(Gln) amidotransferase A subunit family amidase